MGKSKTFLSTETKEKVIKHLTEKFKDELVTGKDLFWETINTLGEDHWNQSFYSKDIQKFRLKREINGVFFDKRIYQMIENNEKVIAYFSEVFEPKEKTSNRGRKSDKEKIEVNFELVDRTACKLVKIFRACKKRIDEKPCVDSYILEQLTLEEQNCAKTTFLLPDKSDYDKIKLTAYIKGNIIRKEYAFTEIQEVLYIGFIGGGKDKENLDFVKDFFKLNFDDKKFDKRQFIATVEKAERTKIIDLPAEED